MILQENMQQLRKKLPNNLFMSSEVKHFLIKFFALIILSPLVGYAVLCIVENLEKARKKKGIKKNGML